jgi:hypothetical protein
MVWAAHQLGRAYVGLDISESYVSKARSRLAALKTRKTGNLFFAEAEVAELKRLLSDMGVTAKQLCADPHLLGWVTNQFRIRMNSKKSYSLEQVLTGSKELT